MRACAGYSQSRTGTEEGRGGWLGPGGGAAQCEQLTHTWNMTLGNTQYIGAEENFFSGDLEEGEG